MALRRGKTNRFLCLRSLGLDLLALSIASLLWWGHGPFLQAVRVWGVAKAETEVSVALPVSSETHVRGTVGKPLTLRMKIDPYTYEGMRLVEVELSEGLLFSESEEGGRNLASSEPRLVQPATLFPLHLVSHEPGLRFVRVKFLNEFRGVLSLQILPIEFVSPEGEKSATSATP